MSCGWLLLFTNVTRPPAATATERGETPLDVMVIVAVNAGVGDGDGELGVVLPPPHAATAKASAQPAPQIHVTCGSVRRTSSKY